MSKNFRRGMGGRSRYKNDNRSNKQRDGEAIVYMIGFIILGVSYYFLK
jgi:hypothetical protein